MFIKVRNWTNAIICLLAVAMCTTLLACFNNASELSREKAKELIEEALKKDIVTETINIGKHGYFIAHVTRGRFRGFFKSKVIPSSPLQLKMKLKLRETAISL